MYGSWDMARDRWTDRQTDGQKKWHIEVGAPPKKYIRIISVLSKMKITLQGHFYMEFMCEEPGSPKGLSHLEIFAALELLQNCTLFEEKQVAFH